MMRIYTCFCAMLMMINPAAADPVAEAALNAFRMGEGRAALAYDPALEAAAAAHAADMVARGIFDHTGSDGSGVGDRITRAGYRWCVAAENIARGHADMDQVLNAWAASPGHRRNMLSPEMRAFGLARAEGPTWVMVLAGPC